MVPKDKTGSGIDEVYLTVFDPNGVTVVTDSTTAPGHFQTPYSY